jgi:hypothetical protein
VTFFVATQALASAERQVAGARRGRLSYKVRRGHSELSAQSKKPSVLALRGPIVVDGSFKSPNVHPATGQIAARSGASAALGVVATPFAALAPMIDPGGAKDADCPALMQEAQTNVSRVALQQQDSRNQRRPG